MNVNKMRFLDRVLLGCKVKVLSLVSFDFVGQHIFLSINDG